MSRDLDSEMWRLAAFLEIEVPPPKWDELVDAAAFANIRARSNDLTPEVTRGFVKPDKFFRRGSSGEWRELFQTESDQQHSEARVAELADPELERWSHSGWAGVA